MSTYTQPNFKKWEEAIADSLWYKQIVPDFQRLAAQCDINRDEYELNKELVYDFFENHLLQNTIALGSTGKNWDGARQLVDTIVIHHTSNHPGIRISRLSAIELIRLYAPYYNAPYEKEDTDIIGQPIYSGHFRNNQQVFYPYHWLVRKNGTPERLLHDEEIGWQAGKWEINCRSVAICFDGDFENSKPSVIQLTTAACLIREQYSKVKKEKVLGHCEVTKTICPSALFLTTESRRGWKEELLALI